MGTLFGKGVWMLVRRGHGILSLIRMKWKEGWVVNMYQIRVREAGVKLCARRFEDQVRLGEGFDELYVFYHDIHESE